MLLLCFVFSWKNVSSQLFCTKAAPLLFIILSFFVKFIAPFGFIDFAVRKASENSHG